MTIQSACKPSLRRLGITAVVALATMALHAQPLPPQPAHPPGDRMPPGGPGGFPFGGPPGTREDLKLVKEFDKDSSGWLNSEERAAARKHLEQRQADNPVRGPGRGAGPGGPGGRPGFGGFGPGGGNQVPPEPGIKISPADVKGYPNEPLYASNVIRTIFLEFDAPDWEQELEAFARTDVEVPARLTMDGKSYPEVGVRFRGNTSYMMVGTGRKRPLNLSMDMAHENQSLLGHRTLNLLNGHEDPSFLRTVLALQMARTYMPAPQANYVRLVINGENWGIYANVEQFNKDFLQSWFGTTKGVRWKVPGSPAGRGGLEYLGGDVKEYRQVYEIKSKDEPKAWASLMNLCRVVTETPADQLPSRLGNVLDIDATLKFLAWDNVLASGDGFWARASDYSLYEDPQGRFHLIPYDVNEAFNTGGGPGGRGPGMFGPGALLAPRILEMGDQNSNGKLTTGEFENVAGQWFDLMDPAKTGQLDPEQFASGLNQMLPPPPGGQGGRGFPGPGRFIGPSLFNAADTDKDQRLTRAELRQAFATWHKQWASGTSDDLDEEAIRNGLGTLMPPPGFAGGAGPGGRRGGPGGMGPRVGPTLDPLLGENDTGKPLLSKLLAVPEYRARYLGYVRHMAEDWLDWYKLGPLARQYHTLIANEVKADTKKLYTFEQFQDGLEGGDSPRGRAGSLKAFAEQRRNHLLNHPEVRKVSALK